METIDNLFCLPKRSTLYIPFAKHKTPSEKYSTNIDATSHIIFILYLHVINIRKCNGLISLNDVLCIGFVVIVWKVTDIQYCFY